MLWGDCVAAMQRDDTPACSLGVRMHRLWNDVSDYDVHGISQFASEVVGDVKAGHNDKTQTTAGVRPL